MSITEEKILIGIVNNPQLCKQAFSVLQKTDFSTEESQTLFHLATQYFNDYLLIPQNILFKDFIRVNISDNRLYQRVIVLYEKLKDEEISKNEFDSAIDIMLKKSLENNFFDLLEKTINSDDDINKKVDKMLKFLLELNTKSRIEATEAIDVSKEAFKYFKSLEKNDKEFKGISTGITNLDNHIGGWKPGELSVITAPTGEGKSIFLLNFAFNAFKQNKNIIFISLEMTYKEVLGRLLSLISSVSYSKLRKLELDKTDKTKIYKSILKNFYDLKGAKIKDAVPKTNNFIILDILGRCTLERIHSEIIPYIRNEKCDIVFIDYINIIEGPKFSERVYSEGYKARMLKVMSREFQIPIVTAAQMNRPNKRDKDSKITAESVKYAKAISENSDWVIGFNINDEDRLLGRIRLELAKHRHASGKTIWVANRFNVMKVDNWSE